MLFTLGNTLLHRLPQDTQTLRQQIDTLLMSRDMGQGITTHLWLYIIMTLAQPHSLELTILAMLASL